MRNILCIAKATYRESVRSRVLYSMFIVALALVVIAALFGTVAVGDQLLIVKDFGLMSISFFSVAFAVISGSSLLHKELSRKTIYNILGKPVHRFEFLLGKYFGILLTIALMISIMGVGLLAFAFCFQGQLDFGLVVACYFCLLELLIICATAILFSSVVVTPSLAGIFTFAIFLAGRSSDSLKILSATSDPSSLSALIIKTLYWLLPRLDALNVANDTVFGASISQGQFIWGTLYALSYAGVLLALATLLFMRREFN